MQHNKTVVKKPASVMRKEDHPVTKAPGGWVTVRDKNVHGILDFFLILQMGNYDGLVFYCYLELFNR